MLSIGTGYDDIGRVQLVTSYAGAGGTGTVVSQVKDTYDGWGNVYREYQEQAAYNSSGMLLHEGMVIDDPVNGSPYVRYDYDDGASGGVAAYVRLIATRCPKYAAGGSAAA